MKKFINTLPLAAIVALTPVVASAQFQADGGPFGELLRNILGFSNNVLIPFILGIGFLVFVWGMFRYFIAGGANDDAKAQGKSLMVYATLGFVLIIIFWGVVNLLAQSTGLDDDTDGLDFNNNALRNVEIEGGSNDPRVNRTRN